MLQYSVGNAGDLDVKPTALFVAVGESLIGRPAQQVDLCVVSNGFELTKNKRSSPVHIICVQIKIGYVLFLLTIL